MCKAQLQPLEAELFWMKHQCQRRRLLTEAILIFTRPKRAEALY